MSRRNIFILGKSGIGKSYYTNCIINETDDEGEIKERTPAGVGTGGKTDETILREPVAQFDLKTKYHPTIPVNIWDTPGIPDVAPSDSKARTVLFADRIVEKIREVGCDLLLIAFPFPSRSNEIREKKGEADFHKVFALIFKAIPNTRKKLLFLNADRKSAEDLAHRTRCLNEFKELGYGELEAITSYSGAYDGPKLRILMQNDLASLLAHMEQQGDGRLDHLQTYTEIKNDHKRCLEGKMHVDTEFTRFINHKRHQLAGIESDIAWHVARIRDCNTGIRSTCWIPFAGQAAGVGMAIAIADSERKLVSLRHKQGTLTVEIADENLGRAAVEREIQEMRERAQELSHIFSDE